MRTQYQHGFPTEEIVEGTVKIMVPRLKDFVKDPSEYAPSKAPVFYNPVMELNRDLSVIALQAYQRSVKRNLVICEPLSGSGVRGIRYAKEIECVKKVLIGDLAERATKLQNSNVKLNDLGSLVEVHNREANALLSDYSAPHRRFDVVDIDPFGSPVPYIDSTLRAIRNNGLLALTATDLAPLCGVHPKACIRRYGGRPMRTEYCHELAIRLTIGCVAALAAKRDMGIGVLFSHSTDHYIRVYASISYGAEKADETLKSIGYLAHCFKCLHRETINNSALLGHNVICPECRAKLAIAGPLWLGGLSDESFVQLMKKTLANRKLSNYRKMDKILTAILGETAAPVGYFVVDELCDLDRLPVPPLKAVIAAVREKDPTACVTHFHSRGIKTTLTAREMHSILQRLAPSRTVGNKS